MNAGIGAAGGGRGMNRCSYIIHLKCTALQAIDTTLFAVFITLHNLSLRRLAEVGPVVVPESFFAAFFTAAALFRLARRFALARLAGATRLGRTREAATDPAGLDGVLYYFVDPLYG